MKAIDFHSHVLPGVDDGSKSVEESIAILDMLSAQGVGHVFATPHFIPEREALHNFLSRRNEAYEKLSMVYTGDVKIHTGAEIAYFPGLTRSSELDSLKLFGTKLLLLEMPMAPWSEYVRKEITELAYSTETVPVIAHVERCMDYQKSAVLREMAESGVLMQTNASFFIDLKTRRKALKLLKTGFTALLGSDTHGKSYRPPRLDEAFSVISLKLGEGVLNSLLNFSQSKIFKDLDSQE